MQLYYFKDPVGNFGDDLNSWLWDSLMPNFFDDDSETKMSGIGTIINTSMPMAKKWYVFSSGVGYGYPPKNFGNSDWNILCVRGPLSAKVLGLDKSKVITDGAALLNALDDYKPLPENERKGTIFIPHHQALVSGEWELVCQAAGIEFVNPQWDSKLVIQKIRRAKLVIADAMHAAIIADAMRVPWIPVVTSPQINTFKWLDWTQTIQLPYKPVILGASSIWESYRSLSLRFYGERYYIDSLTINDAVTDFYFKRDLKSKKWWRFYKTNFERAAFLLPHKILSKTLIKNSCDCDDKYITNAANTLIKLKSNAGYLSDDHIFYDNLERLLDCRDNILKR